MNNTLKILTINICNVSPGGNMKYATQIYLFATIIFSILIILT